MTAPTLNPVEALERLKAGNNLYVQDQGKGELRDQNRRNSNLSKQEPWAIILSCADSRVTPELIFDTGIGELFVVRVAGNVANTSSIASIEYAVAHLGVRLIVVLGHGGCGAVAATVAGGDNGYNLNHLLAHITPAVAATKGDLSDPDTFAACVRKNAELQGLELLKRSSIISGAEASGTVKIVPAFYHLDGKVDFAELR